MPFLLADPVTIGINIALAAVAIGLSVAASLLLQKRIPKNLLDDKPTTVVQRGAAIPVVIGRRRVGPIFAWAGARITRSEKGAGKGATFGGSAGAQTVYFEAGWHILCVGPAKMLHRILQNGKSIFEGPITNESHPSGTTVDLGKEGAFKIYWGEPDQPVDADLTANLAGAVGVASRWPYVCYVLWLDKRLGTFPQWPLLDYEIQTEIQEDALVSSPSYQDATKTLGGTFAVVSVTNGAVSVAKVVIAGDHRNEFRPGEVFRLAGNALADGDYPIFNVTYSGAALDQTSIFFDQVIAGSNNAGTVRDYVYSEDDGLNAAHAIYQLLFANYPFGLGLDTAEWDLDSLETFGALLETEGLASSVIAQDGQELEAVLAGLLQDTGCLIPRDGSTGKFKFQPIRDGGTVVAIDADALVEPVPEIEQVHAEKPVDKMVFTFADRTHNFREMTIAIDDDGQASYFEYQRAQKITVPTTINFDSAVKIAERRSQEELSGGAKYTLRTNRATRRLIPGQAITVEGLPCTLRVAEIDLDSESSRVTVSAITDIYGAQTSAFENAEGGAPFVPARLVELDKFTFLEVPKYLLGAEPQAIVVPRIRAHDEIAFADLWLSRDNVTYNQAGREFFVSAGGALTSQLDASSDSLLTQGPTFDVLGPDIANVLDLTADATNWRLGRQIAVIGDEIFFLQKVTALGGASYRLDGLIRARFDTVRATHAIGARVYIFEQTKILAISDILLAPAVQLYVKSQPSTTGSYPLSGITPVNKTLVGKGGGPPMPMANLRVNSNNTYDAGSSPRIAWNYRSSLVPKTGAGMQGYGQAIGSSPPEGTFVVTITSASPQRIFSTTSASYDYPNATMIADHGGVEPTTISVSIKNTNAGYDSATLSATAKRNT